MGLSAMWKSHFIHTLNINQTPLIGVFFEKLRVVQLGRYSPSFMEPEKSLPLSEKSATGQYSGFLYPVCILPLHFLNNCFNIILPSTPSYSAQSSSFKSSQPTSYAYFHLFHACYVPRLLHPLQLIILIIFGKEYELWISSPCSLLQSPVNLDSVDRRIILKY